METETTIADAKSQLSVLAEVKEAAVLEAHPAPRWWMPFVVGLVGPFAVAVQVFDGFSEAILVTVLLSVFAIAAIVEGRKTRVRRSVLSLPRNVKISKGLFLLAMGLGIAAIGALTQTVNNVLLGVLAYGACVLSFWLWGSYMKRVIERCSRLAAAS